MICKCGREFSNSQSLNSHQRWCIVVRGEGNINKAGGGGWNKGLTQEIDPRVKISDEAKIKMSIARTGLHLSEAHKLKLSILAKARNFGGHTSKVKLYFKKKDGTEIYLQSSYEIKYATFLEESNVSWIRPGPLNWIDDSGNSHKYYGDFYLQDFDVYVDTKNDFLIKKDAEKIKRVIEQNNVDLKVLSSKELDWLPCPVSTFGSTVDL